MSSLSAAEPRPAGPRARPDFERIALLLQGGGALGSYQGGVCQALAESDLDPDSVAGISIGAINSALIAGNAPERRVERLRSFDMERTLRHPEVLERPKSPDGVFTLDLNHQGREPEK
jgi:predicted acylesterase/phospholipase RssA